MPLHLTKIAFGCDSLAILEARLSARGTEARLTTRYRPKRAAEIVMPVDQASDDQTNGSLYWIIAHRLVARSPILRFDDAEGGKTDIVIEARCIPIASRPRRAHQGWRYLADDVAPADLGGGTDSEALPAALRAELDEMGLL